MPEDELTGKFGTEGITLSEFRIPAGEYFNWISELSTVVKAGVELDQPTDADFQPALELRFTRLFLEFVRTVASEEERATDRLLGALFALGLCASSLGNSKYRSFLEEERAERLDPLVEQMVDTCIWPWISSPALGMYFQMARSPLPSEFKTTLEQTKYTFGLLEKPVVGALVRNRLGESVRAVFSGLQTCSAEDRDEQLTLAKSLYSRVDFFFDLHVGCSNLLSRSGPCFRSLYSTAGI